MKIETLKNIEVLLKTGEWKLSAQNSTILLTTINEVEEEIKKLETPKETTEPVKE